jgi:hypothetical protein
MPSCCIRIGSFCNPRAKGSFDLVNFCQLVKMKVERHGSEKAWRVDEPLDK